MTRGGYESIQAKGMSVQRSYGRRQTVEPKEGYSLAGAQRTQRRGMGKRLERQARQYSPVLLTGLRIWVFTLDAIKRH